MTLSRLYFVILELYFQKMYRQMLHLTLEKMARFK